MLLNKNKINSNKIEILQFQRDAKFSLIILFYICIKVDSYTNMNLLAHRSHALRFRDANEMQSINLNAHSLRNYFILKEK